MSLTQDQLHAIAKKFAIDYKFRSDKNLDGNDQIDKEVAAEMVKREASASNSSSDSTSTSTSKSNGKITLKLHNKGKTPIEISYESSTPGGSRTQTSINSRTMRSVTMAVGCKFYMGKTKNVLLTIPADMEDTEQVIEN